jgi:uncharacterized membrane protein (UPF0127 family)
MRFWIAFSLAFLLLGCLPQGLSELYDLQIVTKSQTHDLKVEVADTPESLTRGLMFRENLPKKQGMLFLFNTDSEKSFWMKNTLIPLDIIFARSDGTIIHIHHMAKPRDETGIKSGGSARIVLEILGGQAKELDIRVGDKLISEKIKEKHND